MERPIVRCKLLVFDRVTNKMLTCSHVVGFLDLCSGANGWWEKATSYQLVLVIISMADIDDKVRV